MEFKLVKKLDKLSFWQPLNHMPNFPPVGYQVAIKHAVKTLMGLIKTKYQVKLVYPTISTEVVIAFNSINQKEALRPLIEALENKVTVLDFTGTETDYLAHLKLHHPILLLANYFLFRNRDREVIKRGYFRYFKTLGRYEFIRISLKKSKKVKLFIAANDHIGIGPEGFKAAKILGIQTLYIQHASVTENFPPLDVDYALLEGEDSLLKYLNFSVNSKTKIHVIGCMKLDRFLKQINLDVLGNDIGICIGMYNCDVQVCLELCKLLVDSGKSVRIRFHPSVPHGIRKLFDSNKLNISNPESENALDFIVRCNLIVSSDSTILLEAILLNRKAIYFPSTGKQVDYYGYIANKLLSRACSNLDEVIAEIEFPHDKFISREKAKYYVQNLETENATKSALDILSNILKT